MVAKIICIKLDTPEVDSRAVIYRRFEWIPLPVEQVKLKCRIRLSNQVGDVLIDRKQKEELIKIDSLIFTVDERLL